MPGLSEIGLFIANQLGLDLPKVTALLNDPKNEQWLVEQVGRDKVEHGVKNKPPTKRHAHHHD